MLSPLPPIWICKKLYFAWAQSRPLPWLALSICLFAFLHRAEPRGEDKGYKKEKGRIKFFFSWAPKSLWMVTAAMKLKDNCFLEEKLWQTWKWKCKSISHSVVSNSETAWTVALQASLSTGILQARTLEWVAMPSSRGSSQSRDWTQISRIAGRFFLVWATREAQEYWSG